MPPGVEAGGAGQAPSRPRPGLESCRTEVAGHLLSLRAMRAVGRPSRYPRTAGRPTRSSATAPLRQPQFSRAPFSLNTCNAMPDILPVLSDSGHKLET